MDDGRVQALVQQELRSGSLAVLVRQVQGLIIPGRGAPSAAPSSDRAIYLDLDGALGSIGYVWDGSAWTAFA